MIITPILSVWFSFQLGILNAHCISSPSVYRMIFTYHKGPHRHNLLDLHHSSRIGRW
jgi:hypothetical protein